MTNAIEIEEHLSSGSQMFFFSRTASLEIVDLPSVYPENEEATEQTDMLLFD